MLPLHVNKARSYEQN